MWIIGGSGLTCIDALGNEPVAERNKEQYEQEESAGFVIEEPADKHKEDIAQVEAIVDVAWILSHLCASRAHFHDDGKHRIDQCEERPEIELGKEQWAGTIESKYVVEKLHFWVISV